jgi:hypothetical protein
VSTVRNRPTFPHLSVVTFRCEPYSFHVQLGVVGRHPALCPNSAGHSSNDQSFKTPTAGRNSYPPAFSS